MIIWNSRHIAVRGLLSAGGALTASIAASSAWAQDTGSAPAPVAEAAADDGAIIVTARRREENVQDVPVAIQVLGAEELIRRGVTNESDLQTVVPGLLVRTNNNQFQLNYVLRGESFEPYSGTVPGVQPYVNEVALSGNAPPPFYDIQNVQVLKGPQGTLFGRNSTGGAVLYQTARPTADFGGFVSAQYGSFDRFIGEAAVTLPIAPDILRVRVAGTYQSGGAFVRNLFNNRMEGDAELASGRITIELNPLGRFRNTTMFQYTDIDAQNISKRVIYVAACGVGAANPCWQTPSNPFFQNFVNSPPGTYFPGWPNGNVYNGALQNFIAYLDANGSHTVSANATGANTVTDTLLTNLTVWELSDSITLRNVFGYSDTERFSQTDNDNTPYPFLETASNAGGLREGRFTQAVSNELQLQGEAFNNRLNYIVGFFYSDTTIEYDSPLRGFSYNPNTNVGAAFNIRYRAETTDTSYAAFAQGTYALTDQLNLTAGLRQTWNELSIKHLPGSLFAAAPGQSTNVEDLSWTLSLDYRVTPELMFFAATRGSWRVGGYNPFVPTGTGNTPTADVGGNYFLPQTVRDVEVGLKYEGQLGTMPFRLNVNGFYVWAENIEKTGTTIVNGRVTSATLSVPAGEIYGIEGEFNIRPTSWLTLGGNATWNRGVFTDRQAVIFGQPVEYNTFPDTPDFSASIYADIRLDLGGNLGAINLHGDLFTQSSFHLTSLGLSFVPGDTIPGYTLANFRIDWIDPLGARGITASAFVRNAFDEFYFTGGGGGVQANGTNSGVLGQPRAFGVALRAEF